MTRRDPRAPDPSRSPLADLGAELRALDRKRHEAIQRAESARRVAPPTRITPGAWTELESAVYLERAA